jgi:hypothetical protein
MVSAGRQVVVYTGILPLLRTKRALQWLWDMKLHMQFAGHGSELCEPGTARPDGRGCPIRSFISAAGGNKCPFSTSLWGRRSGRLITALQ